MVVSICDHTSRTFERVRRNWEKECGRKARRDDPLPFQRDLKIIQPSSIQDATERWPSRPRQCRNYLGTSSADVPSAICCTHQTLASICSLCSWLRSCSCMHHDYDAGCEIRGTVCIIPEGVYRFVVEGEQHDDQHSEVKRRRSLQSKLMIVRN